MFYVLMDLITIIYFDNYIIFHFNMQLTTNHLKNKRLNKKKKLLSMTTFHIMQIKIFVIGFV